MKKSIILTVALTIAAAAQAGQPAPDSMLTDWGQKVTPANAWQEYPRPQLERKEWKNLNGLWQYQVTPKLVTAAPTAWAGEILVPFAIEAPLSGVKKRITPEDALWYRRTFEAGAKKEGTRTLLNFEAVDYECTVWVNEQQVGTHVGGNLPFAFDITDALKAGANTLTVRVLDATDTAYQLNGKQVLDPKGIWYTPVSGIWQTVWLETVPAVHVQALHTTVSISGKVTVCLTVSGRAPQATVTASLGGKQVAKASGPTDNITLNIPEPKLWSPDSPTLYDLQITVGADVVTSYVGLRESTVGKDAAGNLRLLLNGKPLFHFGTLDQGWWPDGLLTPPSEAAMRSDIEFLKAAGFNTIRKHIKVEPRQYYLACDRLGVMMWQDQVSAHQNKKKGEKNSSPAWTRLKPNPEDADWPEAAHKQYMAELQGMMELLRNHPCITVWVPFNEAWGQHRTVEVGKWAMAFDPTRPINIASGGNFHPVGHIVDHHQYPHPGFPFELGEGGRFDGFVKLVGEFGGHGFPVEGHLWNPNAKNWGYGGLPKDKDEWLERYKTSIAKLAELKQQGIAAGIYTQTTDVEGEINGLITYDRKVQKLAPQKLAEIHKQAGLVP